MKYLPVICLLGFLGYSAVSQAEIPDSLRCQEWRDLPSGLSNAIPFELANGIVRYYQVVTPNSFPTPSPPVIFELHASSISPQTQLSISNSDAWSSFHAAALVLPMAVKPFSRGGTTWNIPFDDRYDDDTAFIFQLMDNLQQQGCISSDKVYLTGYSGGARMASHLLCDAPERFKAAAVVAGIRFPERDGEQCQKSSPPLLVFHSTTDPVNPYEFTSDMPVPDYWSYDVESATTGWAQLKQCQSQQTLDASPLLTKISYQDCTSELEVWLMSSGGHTWPGSQFNFPEAMGRAIMEISATEAMYGFFQKHGL